MQINWIDRLGDWNPQLLRELKGRLKPRNLLIAGAISLLGQLLLFMSFNAQLPIPKEGSSYVKPTYCISNFAEYSGNSYGEQCLRDNLGNVLINWQLWWLDLFLWLSMIGIFVLLVAGTHLLISDLASEERRDTLNFIRLSPQSSASILVGKLLGVPILLYLVAGLAVPLHLWSGLTAQIPLGLILSFYGVVAASCLFFYSAALLFGLVSSWLGGFQAWLGSGTVLIFLLFVTYKSIEVSATDWLNLFSPALVLQYLVSATGLDSQSPLPHRSLSAWKWFVLPLRASTVSVVSFAVLNYGLWTYWSWQALKRRFPNPTKTILSKRQSYLLVACFELVTLGFAIKGPSYNFIYLLTFNLLLFLGLIMALTPHRQAVEDWARYRRQQVDSRKSLWNRSLVQDLIWGEKSPALVAIALNLAIAATFLVSWIAFGLHSGLHEDRKLPALLSLSVSFNLILLYAAIAQLILFMRTHKQVLWITGTLSAAIILPPVVLCLLYIDPAKTPAPWLFTPFAWVAIEHASATTIFMGLLSQWSALILCTLQINRQLRRAGESASKALFKGARGE